MSKFRIKEINNKQTSLELIVENESGQNKLKYIIGTHKNKNFFFLNF
jgi:hypothetical protein